MQYAEYLSFYNLDDTEENRESWIYNEWHHGRVYQYNGKFYDVTTNKEIK